MSVADTTIRPRQQFVPGLLETRSHPGTVSCPPSAGTRCKWSFGPTYPSGVGYLFGEVVDMMYWNGMGPWGWLMMVVFWAVIILLIAWAIRSTTTPAQRDESKPLRILDERLARGEIDREDYEERRQLLAGRR